jgi:alkanesulfonate monooxygenase SsuD/methylene tetrahydromethanopterin reductase-like flavin-dependent oxidoreductase (luciferase family)
MTSVALNGLPRTVAEAMAYAEVAQDRGYWGLGIADSHFLYPECYPMVTAALLRTATLRVGPWVTNCTSRSWSIHAAAARAHDQLAPGRCFLGLGVGDSSVSSVGLRPTRWDQLETDAAQIRERSPESLTILMPVSGPIAAAHAGRIADVVVVATGTDEVAIATLRDRAIAASRAAGRIEGPDVWARVAVLAVEDASEVADARDRAISVAIGSAQYSFTRSLEDKNIPSELAPRLVAGLARYDHVTHGVQDGSSPNDRLFDTDPEAREYLLNRMVMVDTASACAQRAADLVERLGLAGLWLSITWPDGVEVADRVGRAFAPLMKESP